MTPMTDLFDDRGEWVRDYALEQRMARDGITYKLAFVDIAELDLDASLKQSGRVDGGLDKDIVTEYACSQIDGDAFPAGVVAWIAKRKKYLIIIGNHRIHAAVEAGRDRAMVYVLQTSDPMVLSSLGRGDNARIGKKPTVSERCQAAKFLMDNFGYSQADAARINKVEKAIGSFMRAEKVRVCVAKAGLPAAKFPDTVACELSPILSVNPLVCVAAARVVLKYKLTSKQTSELSKSVRKETCEDDMLRRVDAYGDRVRQLQSAPHRMAKLPKRAAMLRWISHGRGLVDAGRRLEEHQITADPDYSTATSDLKVLHHWIEGLLHGQLRAAV